jgi:formylglycine-generating enzyme required for sulfatase activity
MQGGAAGAAGGPSEAEEPPSCTKGGPGLTTCGANGDESCCTSLPVAGGTFYRTYTTSGSAASGTADPATVSAFRLDKYEVTVGRFRQFVEYLAGGGSPPAAGSGKHTHLNGGKGLADSGHSGSYEPGWDASWNSNIPSGSSAATKWGTNLNCSSYATWTASAGSNEMLPLTCLDWYEAHAFCIWDGGFLPSEAEWRYAAAGGDQQRKYPWGSMDPGSSSQYAMYNCYYPTGTGGNCTSLSNVAKVGSTPLGAGRWGQLDLSGSDWEWNLDVYTTFANPCTDCAAFSGGSNRELPGGGFHSSLQDELSYNRADVSYATTYRGDYGVGVRCARTP